jgi:phosphonopyruvate decarboxylase
MIPADTFLVPARARGFDFYSGVPCSFLTPVINRVISDRSLDYVGATSEGEAVAIAAGAWLAGRKTVVMCQNSGLGNTVNPLTSLNWPFRIPTLLIVTWRGQPGLKDEPQHALMGTITAGLLDTMQIPHAPFPDNDATVEGTLAKADREMTETGLPYALIMEKGAVQDDGLDQEPVVAQRRGERLDFLSANNVPSRAALLEACLAAVPDDTAIVATTGKAGRELFTLADRPQHLYQVGSMGCASAMGLGLALNTSKQVLVIDGDGAALMKMGNMATIGAVAPDNLVHVLLDNGVHDSTGGQGTVSPNVDFAAVALGCGYRTAIACDNLEGFRQALQTAQIGAGPTMIHARIEPGSISPLGRPTVKPPEVARRFRSFVTGE